jgi:hypothetical protein
VYSIGLMLADRKGIDRYWDGVRLTLSKVSSDSPWIGSRGLPVEPAVSARESNQTVGKALSSSRGASGTDAERALLRHNTARLIEQLEAENQQAAALAATRSASRAAKLPRAQDVSVPTDAIFSAEAQVKREMRAEGFDPDAAGWRGVVDTRVEKMLGLPTLTLHRLRHPRNR